MKLKTQFKKYPSEEVIEVLEITDKKFNQISYNGNYVWVEQTYLYYDNEDRINHYYIDIIEKSLVYKIFLRKRKLKKIIIPPK